MLAPICLFTYNRLYELKLTVEALKENDFCTESELFIFSDGPKNPESVNKVTAVRNFIQSLNGFKNISIIESNHNQGLADSIINGVSQIIERYGKVIVLEDDLITSPGFLTFMNQALEFYKSDQKIQSVSGFSLKINQKKNESDVYFQKRPFSWGWATWADRWESDIFNKNKLKSDIKSSCTVLKDFKKECGNDISNMFIDSINNKNDSWYVRWVYNHFKTNRYSVYPYFSLVKNIGFNKEGTHCKTINPYSYQISSQNNHKFEFINFRQPTHKETKEFLKYFSYPHKIKVRIKLLGTSSGRMQLLSELKTKFQK